MSDKRKKLAKAINDPQMKNLQDTRGSIVLTDGIVIFVFILSLLSENRLLLGFAIEKIAED